MKQYTKEALSGKLKEISKTKPIDKITVTELVEACDIKRQTFYYHFQDIYDLLSWIYRTEAMSAIQNKLSYSTWQERLEGILQYAQNKITKLFASIPIVLWQKSIWNRFYLRRYMNFWEQSSMKSLPNLPSIPEAGISS